VWDGLDEAIVGMANKAVNGEIIILDGDGEEVIIDSSDDAYLEYGDDVNIDRWDRDEFGPIAYDIDKMIEILAKDMEVDLDDLDEYETEDERKYTLALEFYDYNTNGAYVGEFTPLHIHVKKIKIDKYGLDYYSEFQNYNKKHMGMSGMEFYQWEQLQNTIYSNVSVQSSFNTLYLRRKRIKGNANGYLFTFDDG
jgi:hypothetical protein